MKKFFWHTLPRPFFVLAPMANVTDVAFREIIATYGKPDVLMTEFVSCHGLCSAGQEKLLPDLWYTDKQRPIFAQIFGAEPKHFYECARLLADKGFDGIDINMGCPDRNVEKQGGGAALIKDPKRAQQIIEATKKGAPHLPVSVKTRIGYNRITIDEWLPYLLEARPAAITIHARTRKEMSDVPARWDVVAQAVARVRVFDATDSRPLIIGNGDVTGLEDARAKAAATGVDGVMVGRGVFGNPWFFAPKHIRDAVTLQDRLRVMVEHTELFEKTFSGIKPFDIMKKHYKAYVSGFDGAKELRAKLMNTKNSAEVRALLSNLYSL
ncbi:tRNA-dihydrouridine synthase [Candidatus Uhrbacteria bacterium]|nr:tRNA-dihydrouridine synthase [Candidatus Uhrbacteria bacterium]